MIGTIGAYRYKDNHTEVGFSVKQSSQGCGFAAEALEKVLGYLAENEGISCVTTWCAADNIQLQKMLEKAEMRLVRTGQEGLAVGDRVYDKMIYEYRRES